MGYKSENLPSYPKLRNCSYSVKLITPLPCLFLRFIYPGLISSLRQPDRPQHLLRLCTKYIDGAAGKPLQSGRLKPLDAHPDGVDPRGFHSLLYQWLLPLSACPAFSLYPRDPSRRLMVEPRQNLEHLPGHHPNLAAI